MRFFQHGNFVAGLEIMVKHVFSCILIPLVIHWPTDIYLVSAECCARSKIRMFLKFMKQSFRFQVSRHFKLNYNSGEKQLKPIYMDDIYCSITFCQILHQLKSKSINPSIMALMNSNVVLLHLCIDYMVCILLLSLYTIIYV